MFASQVETLGDTYFPNSFTGAVVSDGTVDVYTTNPTSASLRSGIASQNTSAFPVDYIGSSRSYEQLDSMTDALTADQANLAADGVKLEEAAPDPATDTVAVTVAAPPTGSLPATGAEYTTASGGLESVAAYTANAQSAVASQLGAGYAIDPQPEPIATTAGRVGDTAPFYGGDQIFGALQCTGGFNVTGNASGNPFMLTAAHCGSNTAWTTSAQVIGHTTKLYIQDSNNDDFQTITEASGLGYVWVSGGSSRLVGTIDPATGALITVDGSVSGEQTDTTVANNDATLYGLTSSQISGSFTAAHLVLSYKNSVICAAGDSGGPTFQRTPSGTANAVGTIVAYYSYAGTPGWGCAAERIGVEESQSNSTIMMG
jgi:hypothetical protein